MFFSFSSLTGLLFSFLSIFFRSSRQSETFFASTFLSVRYEYLPSAVVGTPSSSRKAGSEREELRRFYLPVVRHNFSPIVRPSPLRAAPFAPFVRASSRAAPSLSSDFPHSIFAISTSDIENSQSGSAAWSYSQWHYSVPLSHPTSLPRARASSRRSPVSLGGIPRARMREDSCEPASGSIRRFARWGITDAARRARLGVLFCMRARVARLLRFDSTSGRTGARVCTTRRSVSILLCPNASAACIEIFPRTWLDDKWISFRFESHWDSDTRGTW